ncbi:MAG: L-histidine N(alpha)-methyltransferase [Solirubrobacteraceae bacterium]
MVSGQRVSLRRADGVAVSTLADDVRKGFSQPLRELPPKHFYDERGSELFEQICRLPEYYPTRVERSILERRAGDIARLTDATELVELGAGTAAKTRVLLDALRDHGTLARYIPFDIDAGTLHRVAVSLASEYPALQTVDCVAGDFERDLALIPARHDGGRRVVAFLGGTIGNFDTQGRRRLLGSLVRQMDARDRLLLGADLVKDPAVLEAAYDDAAGVTAEFNRNILAVVNRELDADFPVQEFAHVAFYDQANEWIEMRLRATRAVTVTVRAVDMVFSFMPGDEIRTEISAKFTPARLEADLAESGLRVVELMTDPAGLFALVLARPA